jgi:hypothetical protein
MISNLQFITLVAGFLAYVATFFYPNFPLDEEQILAGVLFLLGLIGVTPTIRAINNPAVTDYTIADLFKSFAFWTLVAGILGFVIRYYKPDFPYTDAVILSVIVFLLNQFGIKPEARSAEVSIEFEEDF